MRVLTILNNRHAPAGYFGTAILKRGGYYDSLLAPEASHSLDPTATTEVPEAPGDYDGLIVLGGLMRATDDAEHPYLPRLAALIRSFEAEGRPVLGICLGAQLMARAWGADGWRMPSLEIGFTPLRTTPAGLADPLLRGLDPQPALMQWHVDSFDLPEGAELLMTGTACANQAFRIGHLAYGLQFHCEAPVDSLRQWVMTYAHHAEDAPAGFFEHFDAQVRQHHLGARRWAESFADRWVDLVATTRRQRQAA
ncbi:type 1 glutamine amidotransferase [Algihabitans albus]|uniref:type 1 glutamine amidotransferase n=1 Tax=Algihabitans albus TaxID=2164067 RepID=UPI000E5D9F8E|nr:type 1 glutamine amidotransferase [Algihabitans albus]